MTPAGAESYKNITDFLQEKFICFVWMCLANSLDQSAL